MTEGGMEVVCFEYKNIYLNVKNIKILKKCVRRRRTVAEKLPNLEM